MTDPLVGRLRSLDSCAVSDALDRLGVADRVVTGLTGFGHRGRSAGRAVTVELGPPRAEPSHRHLCAAAVDASGPDDIIVVAHQARTDCAGWGGNLSRAARARQVLATLVDGAVRDVDEALDIGYPVLGRTATPRTARGRTEEHSWGTPISFGGVDVVPGDYVIADSTGVVFLPAAIAAEVIEAAEQIAAKEAAMAADIDAGRPISEVMGASYEQMLMGGRTDG
ncbi:MAG: dimethylmenaquinone methyltransferase [Actinomycetia bacterium]|nr:dimethylmenaquinone methyltransferase [Actinomycetes bacterium]